MKVRAQVEIYTKFFSAIIFISVLLGLIDFSYIVVTNNTLSVLIYLYWPLLSLGLFS